MTDDIDPERKFSNGSDWNNSIDWDDASDGSDGGYNIHGSPINAEAMKELIQLRMTNARLQGLLVEAQDYIDDVYDPLYINIGQELERLKRTAAIHEGKKDDGQRNL